ncbi:flippase [Paradesertivirga mongoliensis]|uniref:Flippase n=1 Tax=Paradesertivirga mongoliensis TaxID=2100740 RepID=A0ABW4ZM62_9SPHI|nr:flippase [Pedobacter mongoliensis]
MEQKNNRSYWLKSGIINVAQNLTTQILSIATFWFMARLFTKEDNGSWVIYMQAVVIFELLRNGLTQSAVIKFLAGSEKEDHSKIVTASFAISTILTVILVLLNIIFVNYFTDALNAPQLQPVFYLFNIVFVLSGILTILCAIEQANLQYKSAFAANFIRTFSVFIYCVYCYFFNHTISLLELAYVQIISMTISLIWAWRIVKKFFQFTYIFSWYWVRKIFNYGKYALGTSVSSQLSGTIDQWMLAGMLTPAASASFSTAVRITNLINIPTDAVVVIVFPQSAKRMHTEGKDAIKYLYEKSVGTILAILIPAVLFVYLFDSFIVNLIAGGKYADAVPILNVTLLYCLLIPFGRQFGTILDSIGKTNLTFYIVLVTAATNLILNYFFIKEYGVIGAAYATGLSNVIGFAIAQVILRKELKVNMLNTFIYAYMFYPEFINKYILKKS